MPTLDLRTSSLIEVSTLSSRPELRNELIAKFRIIKLSANITGVELYEVCLQTYLFAGFPAALESVRALSKVFDHQEYNNREQRTDVDGYNALACKFHKTSSLPFGSSGWSSSERTAEATSSGAIILPFLFILPS